MKCQVMYVDTVQSTRGGGNLYQHLHSLNRQCADFKELRLVSSGDTHITTQQLFVFLPLLLTLSTLCVVVLRTRDEFYKVCDKHTPTLSHSDSLLTYF